MDQHLFECLLYSIDCHYFLYPDHLDVCLVVDYFHEFDNIKQLSSIVWLILMSCTSFQYLTHNRFTITPIVHKITTVKST